MTFVDKCFDLKTLPTDMQRAYSHLHANIGEDYALTVVFLMRTAIELHRSGHMTLLTNRVLRQIKDHYMIRMAWELSVFKIKFYIEDGSFVLIHKVPTTTDSETQDLLTKVATAFTERRINIHQALLFQTEIKQGVHTAKSGLLLRQFPARLLFYPFQAATCAVMFHGKPTAIFG